MVGIGVEVFRYFKDGLWEVVDWKVRRSIMVGIMWLYWKCIYRYGIYIIDF